MKEFKLIDSGKTIGDSFAMGCKIFKTKYDDFFLSEIDTTTGEDLRDKGVLCVVYKNGENVGMISKIFLQNENEMNNLITGFHQKTDIRQMDLFDTVAEAIKPEAEILRDKGMQRAEDKANLNSFNWSIIAYTLLQKYVKITPTSFLAEDFREWASKQGLEDPPSKRAFGSIIKKANKDKLIRHCGYGKTKNPKAHCTPASLWTKRVYLFKDGKATKFGKHMADNFPEETHEIMLVTKSGEELGPVRAKLSKAKDEKTH